METELLNEYLFADLVVQYAHHARTRRIHALIQSGAATQDEMNWGAITSEDLRTGLAQLDERRLAIHELRRESA